ncbi:MAG: substrate-binding domain-containing protein [Oscillospiraceae bacterium]
MKKRAFCLFLAAALSLSALCACTAGANGTTSADSSAGVSISTPSKGKNAMSSRLVGISMPEQAGRWEQEATTMQTILQAKDYTVELAYADNNSDTQIEQVKAMLDDDCGAIIVASVDSEALSDALATCDTSNTTMIAYSTLVPDCSTIDYFIGIDSYTNGQIQAKYLVQKLGLKKTKKSFNLEIFHQSNSGSALYAFLGAMDVLKPYLDDSTLVIPSDRTTAETCGVTDAAEAKKALGHLLESTYADGKPLDAILCTDDTLSVAVAQELQKDYSGSVFPLISGCNCNPESIQLLMDGKLSVTSVENTQKIAQQAAKMADQAMQGKTVEQSKQNPYDVPAYVYEPVKVTLKNYKDVLFKTGLYKKNKDGTISHAAHKSPVLTEDDSDKAAADQKKTEDKTKETDKKS